MITDISHVIQLAVAPLFLLAGIGALVLGMASDMSGVISTGFWLVTIAMFVSGLAVWIWGEETHPRLNPAAPDK